MKIAWGNFLCSVDDFDKYSPFGMMELYADATLHLVGEGAEPAGLSAGARAEVAFLAGAVLRMGLGAKC